MLIIVSILIGLGIFGLILFLLLIWSNFWPVAAGKLINSAAKTVRINGRDYYQLNVNYMFEVGSERHESRSIMFLGGGLHKHESTALKLSEEIGKKPLNVRYCPLHPAWSYLRPNKVLIITMPLCALISFAGAFLFYTLFIKI